MMAGVPQQPKRTSALGTTFRSRKKSNMGRTLGEVMAGLPEERQARIKSRAAELHREVERLKGLRKLA